MNPTTSETAWTGLCSCRPWWRLAWRCGPRQVYLSLFAGLWLGTIILVGGNPIAGLRELADQMIAVFADAGNTRVVIFCLLVGGLIALVQASGGVAGFVGVGAGAGLGHDAARGPSSWPGSVGMLIFVESSITSLTVGAVSRPFFRPAEAAAREAGLLLRRHQRARLHVDSAQRVGRVRARPLGGAGHYGRRGRALGRGAALQLFRPFRHRLRARPCRYRLEFRADEEGRNARPRNRPGHPPPLAADDLGRSGRHRARRDVQAAGARPADPDWRDGRDDLYRAVPDRAGRLAGRKRRSSFRFLRRPYARQRLDVRALGRRRGGLGRRWCSTRSRAADVRCFP